MTRSAYSSEEKRDVFGAVKADSHNQDRGGCFDLGLRHLKDSHWIWSLIMMTLNIRIGINCKPNDTYQTHRNGEK